MVEGFKYAYDGFVGGKTGYTSDARQTLVSCAEKNGVKLICVIMKEESPDQFLDTQKLFDYGFDGFKLVNIRDNETKYNLDSSTFFDTDLDIMGSSKQAIVLNSSGNIMIPKTAEFSDTDVILKYLNGSDESVAGLFYSFSGNPVGSTTIDYAESDGRTFEFSNIIRDSSNNNSPKKLVHDKKIIFVNIKRIIIILAIILIVLIVFFFIKSFISSYSYSSRHLGSGRKKRYKKRNDKLNL